MTMQQALSIHELGVSFSGFKAVDGVSLSIGEGELRVLLGANGAGKSTLMDLISGRTRATSGRVLLFGREITHLREHQIARAGLGRKFQIPSVFRDLTVAQNLAVAATPRPGVLANLGLSLVASDRARLAEIVELAGLQDLLRLRAGDLSHGQMQWLELAILIAQDARMILLDEPTAGMSQAETRKTSEIINRLKGQHTLLVVEHDMSFVRDIAETITVLHLGKVLAEGSIDQIQASEEVRAAYLGSGGIH